MHKFMIQCNHKHLLYYSILLLCQMSCARACLHDTRANGHHLVWKWFCELWWINFSSSCPNLLDLCFCKFCLRQPWYMESSTALMFFRSTTVYVKLNSLSTNSPSKANFSFHFIASYVLASPAVVFRGVTCSHPTNACLSEPDIPFSKFDQSEVTFQKPESWPSPWPQVSAKKENGGARESI